MARGSKLVLDDAEFHELVTRVLRLLDGLSVAQIEHTLRTVSRVVAVTTPFAADSEEVGRKLAAERPSASARAN
jgi:hypothetical protein